MARYEVILRNRYSKRIVGTRGFDDEKEARQYAAEERRNVKARNGDESVTLVDNHSSAFSRRHRR